MRQALTRQWTRFLPILSAFVMSSVRDRQHAEDIVQEVGAVVSAKFSQIPEGVSFNRWVLGVARNQIVERQQQQPVVAVATLSAEHDARWSIAAGGSIPQVGGTLAAGQILTLTQGFAQITTQRGAVAILEAPCTIEMIDSPNAIRLVTGKLVGLVETDWAKGFLIRTPHLDVTDLGTEFGVAVRRSGATWAEVFVGEIAYTLTGDSPDATDTPNTQPVSLLAGQAVAFTEAAGIHRVESGRHRFVRAQAFAAILAANAPANAPAYRRWLAYSDELRADPDLLAYYSFDQGRISASASPNLAQAGAGRLAAALGDGRAWTAPTAGTDRFGLEGQALTFDRRLGQFVSIQDWPEVGPLDQLTVSCWFRLSDDPGVWPLLITQWHDDPARGLRHTFHLGVRDARVMPGPAGQTMGLQAHISFDGTTSGDPGWDIKDEPSIGGQTTAGDGWGHVALTVICGGGPIRLYKNGVEIDTDGATYAPSRLPVTAHPLVIGGKATHQGVLRSSLTTKTKGAFFDGQIDDVAILRRALTAQEVRAMFDAGRPDDASPPW